jgi:hypothetical protein
MFNKRDSTCMQPKHRVQERDTTSEDAHGISKKVTVSENLDFHIRISNYALQSLLYTLV